MKIVIIIPTYNEAENVKILMPMLQKVILRQKDKFAILIVDYMSDDGTKETVIKLKKQYKNLFLLEDTNYGIGKAYIAGFNLCLKKFKPDIIFQMDADLSHPPTLIPAFLNEIEKGYDVVVGSRYIKGGATPDWSISRKIISRMGNTYSRFLLGIPVKDSTSGFRAIKTTFLKKVNFNRILPRGYAFQTQLLYELYLSGAKIKEIPLVFYDRKYGITKLSEKEIMEFITNSIKLRLKK